MVPKQGRPSSLLDTRVIYCGLRRAQSSRDNLEQLKKLPDRCPQRRRSRSERSAVSGDAARSRNLDGLSEIPNYEVFWGETKEKRSFEDRHASTAAYIDYMRPRCVELARVMKKTGSFYYHCDWHTSQTAR